MVHGSLRMLQSKALSCPVAPKTAASSSYMDKKSLILETKDISLQEENTVGYLKAIVSVFNNVDLVNEVVLPGAYAKSLANKLPAAVQSHEWDNPVAKTIEAKELLPGDPLLPESIRSLGGLYVSAEFPLEIEASKQAYLKIKNGLVDEFSVGYRVVDKYEENGITYLKELELLEWSVVMRGANPATKVIEVKNLTFVEHTELTLQQLDTYIERYESLAEKRQKLSINHRNNLDILLGRINKLISLSTPPGGSSKKEYAIELLNLLSKEEI